MNSLPPSPPPGVADARRPRVHARGASALWRQTVLAVSLALAAGPSGADDDCEVPVHLWQSRDAVRQMATAQGWQVQRLKIDDGCYEIRGTDAQGRAFKAKLDPQTLAIVKIKHRHRDGQHPPRPAGAPPAASSASAPAARGSR